MGCPRDKKAGAPRLLLCLRVLVLARVLIVPVIAIVVAPVVIAIPVPSACAMRALIIAAEKCIAIVIALVAGDGRVSHLRIMPRVHVPVRIPIIVGGLDAIVKGAPADIVVVIRWFHVPLNYLRMSVYGAAQRYTHQASKKYGSYEASCMFHRRPHIRLTTSQVP